MNTVVSYGENITLENAKKIVDAARAFAAHRNWTVVMAIVDTGSNLVLLERMDNTQVGSVEVAIAKAQSANKFKRPTKAFQDALDTGATRLLALPGVMPVEGGEPIIVNGKIIGAIGVSGMQSAEDTEVVKAGLAALH